LYYQRKKDKIGLKVHCYDCG